MRGVFEVVLGLELLLGGLVGGVGDLLLEWGGGHFGGGFFVFVRWWETAGRYGRWCEGISCYCCAAGQGSDEAGRQRVKIRYEMNAFNRRKDNMRYMYGAASSTPNART